MAEEILPQLYRIEVPLPKNPLRALNAYLIKDDRSLLIDTGFAREECRSALLAGLTEVGVQPEEVDLFVTHLHADHSGLAGEFAARGSRVYMSQPDAEILNDGIRWEAMGEHAKLNGFPPELLDQTMTRHPARRFGIEGKIDFNYVREGDLLEYGGFALQCVLTPGHTVGHMCLHEVSKRILVSGDHLLDRITPNISLWNDARNPLGDYLRSLDRVSKLDVDLVLPGHRNVFTHFHERIEQLRQHHEKRCDEALSILSCYGAISGCEVASHMKWSLSYESWEQFPPNQKWFGCGEALAHLKLLEERGQVRRLDIGQGRRVLVRA